MGVSTNKLLLTNRQNSASPGVQKHFPLQEADSASPPVEDAAFASLPIRPGVIWAASFAVWTLVAMAATVTVYQFYQMSEARMRFGTIVGMEFGQILTYAPLTPLVFTWALRFPLQRDNWKNRSLFYVLAGLIFVLAHLLLWGATPYAAWNSAARSFSSAFWNWHAHTFRSPWVPLKSMLMFGSVDDITEAYIPTLLIAHAVLYYQRFREREHRAAQLAEQLTKARLQTLKSQMQPHFLFNTLHSISALMLTNVIAADRMMTSLSDLLRMSLEDNGNQLTTLSRELEFVSVYIDIEKARFEDRLHVVFDIAPECLDTQVPHLLLQPLVENAVRHGISKRSQPGEILVIAKHGGDQLEVWVRDNGPGLVESAEEAFQRGLGLRIARERLQELYGERQACRIRNMPEGGAEVYVSMPFSVLPSALKSEPV